MAAITYAYMAFEAGYATPTQLYQIEIAQKARIELDRIRDLADPVNRRKLRVMGENFVRNYLNDGSDEDLDEAIIHAYSNDVADTHEALWSLLDRLLQ